MQAQIDRLVAGELPESERRNLLAWLDEDVGRWRACAVAFLEAQTWEAAAAASPLESATTAVGASEAPAEAAAGKHPRETLRRHPGASRQRGFVGLIALSIALAASFVVGAMLGRQWPAAESHGGQVIVEHPQTTPGTSPTEESRGTVLATVALRSNLDPGVPLQLKLPVTTSDAASHVIPSAISDYERKQLEKRGFEVVEEQRYLPARLPDGRQVVVPVKQVRLKVKGMPVS
jgi:hypothetical protein